MNKELMIKNDFYNCANCVYRIKNIIGSISKNRHEELLKKNKLFKNKYQGKRCFILGNGPSLKYETRLRELEDEIVFTVNQSYRSTIFNEVKSNFHLMMDPLFFELDKSKPEEKEVLDMIIKCSENPEIQMIFPVNHINYIQNNFSSKRHIYISGKSYLPDAFHGKFDMCCELPRFRNVIQFAIACAIYMGFSQIIILGCDMTGLLDNYIKRSPNDYLEKFSHIYEYTENENKRMKTVHSMYSNEFMLSGFAKMFTDYRILSEWCNKHKVVLLNATQETALDMLKYVNLDDVLDGLYGCSK